MRVGQIVEISHIRQEIAIWVEQTKENFICKKMVEVALTNGA